MFNNHLITAVGMKPQKIRGQNFSELEKSTILDLVDQYKDIIENKTNNGKTIKEKSAAWDRITIHFNRQAGVIKRNAQQLRTCYENMKKRARQCSSEGRINLYKTGGETFEKSLDSNGKRLSEILQNQLKSVENEYDSDSQHRRLPNNQENTENLNDSCCTEPNIQTALPVEAINVQSDSIPETSTSNQAASQLNGPLQITRAHLSKSSSNASKVLKISRNNTIANIARASDIRIKYIKEKQKMEKELYNMKKEEHKLEMKIKEEKLLFYKELREALKEKKFVFNLNV